LEEKHACLTVVQPLSSSLRDATFSQLIQFASTLRLDLIGIILCNIHPDLNLASCQQDVRGAIVVLLMSDVLLIDMQANAKLSVGDFLWTVIHDNVHMLVATRAK